MSDLASKLEKLEESAFKLKEAGKYLECLKKFDEALLIRRQMQGEQHQDVLKLSNETAIVCNILSMTLAAKIRTTLTTSSRACTDSRSPTSQKKD